MENLEFKTTIGASKEQVWNTMLNLPTYQQWVGAAWPNSSYEGTWEQGQQIRFIGEDGSGTLAELQELRKYESLVAVHVAILHPGGAEDRESEVATGWIGTTESYYFHEADGGTELTVVLTVQPQWASMFKEGWPTALAKLKELAETEKSTVAA